jgi:heparan-alpha-glucosaminide N-acetyltransferase
MVGEKRRAAAPHGSPLLAAGILGVSPSRIQAEASYSMKTLADTTSLIPESSGPAREMRITSIDALRGLIMFTMIFVNDIAGVSHEIVPWWMRHFPGDENGMTFVDLVFPAFLFIVGMSIPLALGRRLDKGEPAWRTVLHVVARTLSLLFIGILMVNETPDSDKMGWSGALWSTLMFLGAIFAFCTVSPPSESNRSATGARICRVISLALRVLGFGALAFLAFAFRGKDDHRIIALSPFSIHTEWYGILGLIGWAYLVAALVFLFLRTHRTALLGCVALLMCLYPADKGGAFDDFWLNGYVSIGEALGTQAAITVAGVLLASILVTFDTTTIRSRTRFTLLFMVGFAAAALLLHGLYGINKNNATPSWSLWACAITGALWLVLHFLCDIRPVGFIAKPLALAGENVLLAYLMSEMLPAAIALFQIDKWYVHLAEPDLYCAVARSAGCAAIILVVATVLNRTGFRLRL